MDKYFTHDELVFAVKKAVMCEKKRIVEEMEAIREKFRYDLTGVDKYTLDRLRQLVADYYNAESRILAFTETCVGQVNTELALRIVDLDSKVSECVSDLNAAYNQHVDGLNEVYNQRVEDLNKWQLDNSASITDIDLVALGLPTIQMGQLETVKLDTDTTAITEALQKGAVRFHVKAEYSGLEMDINVTMHPLSDCCGYAFDRFGGYPMILTIIVNDGSIWAHTSLLVTRDYPVSIDMSNFDTTGRITETYANGASRATTVEFDENGNPVKITNPGNFVTTLVW